MVVVTLAKMETFVELVQPNDRDDDVLSDMFCSQSSTMVHKVFIAQSDMPQIDLAQCDTKISLNQSYTL